MKSCALLLVAGFLAWTGEAWTASPENLTPAEQAEDRSPLNQWHLLPLPFYSPETSLGVTLMFAYLFRFEDFPDARLSNNMSSLGVTILRQILFKNKGEIFMRHEDWVLAHRLEGRIWPDWFYGLGNESDPDVFERFESRNVLLQVDLGYRLLSRLYVGPHLEARYMTIGELEPGGALERGEVPGTRPYGLLGVGGLARWDSRDSNLNPGSGVFAEVGYLHFPRLEQDGFEFNTLAIDLRTYLPLFEGHVVAARLSSSTSFSHMPFQLLPVIGGDHSIRGIMEQWVRDKQAVFGLMEYRWNFWWRFGITAFGGVGQAQSSFEEFTWQGWHVAGGVGLRFMVVPKERINLRVDVAYSDFGEVQAYFAVGEAF